MRVAERIELDTEAERELRALSKRRRIEARLQQRAQVRCPLLFAFQPTALMPPLIADRDAC
jgi:hypothetical protein